MIINELMRIKYLVIWRINSRLFLMNISLLSSTSLLMNQNLIFKTEWAIFFK